MAQRHAPSVYYGLMLPCSTAGRKPAALPSATPAARKGNITWHKDMGLVGEVFRAESVWKPLNGNIGIGHVRYSTTGASTAENAQPLVLKLSERHAWRLPTTAIITNAAELRQALQEGGAIFRYHHGLRGHRLLTSPRERTRTACVEDAILQTARRLKGGYALVIISPRKLIGVRDPLGLKPLCLGKRGAAATSSHPKAAPLTAVGASIRP